jgi:hypothetical protein
MCRNRVLALHNTSVNSTSLSTAMCSSDVPHMTFFYKEMYACSTILALYVSVSVLI